MPSTLADGLDDKFLLITLQRYNNFLNYKLKMRNYFISASEIVFVVIH